MALLAGYTSNVVHSGECYDSALDRNHYHILLALAGDLGIAHLEDVQRVEDRSHGHKPVALANRLAAHRKPRHNQNLLLPVAERRSDICRSAAVNLVAGDALLVCGDDLGAHGGHSWVAWVWVV